MTGPEGLEGLVQAFIAGGAGEEAVAELTDGLRRLLAPLVSRYGLDALTEAYLLLCGERTVPVRNWAAWLCRAVKACLAAAEARERSWLECPVGGVVELERSVAVARGLGGPLSGAGASADESAFRSGFMVDGTQMSDAWPEELEAVLVEEAFWPSAVARECVDALALYVDGCTGRWSAEQLRHRLGMLPPGVRCEVARALLDGAGYLGLRARGLGPSQARAEWLLDGGDVRLLWDVLGAPAWAA